MLGNFLLNQKKGFKKTLDEGRGFRLFDNERKNAGTFDFATSNELWRASLDTLDFMPLDFSRLWGRNYNYRLV
jgi:hypothetical protein